VTLDGCYQLPLVSKVRGTSVAWQVLPPADCNRNPPHGPMAAAMARAKGLEYRGYTVVQVGNKGLGGGGKAVKGRCCHTL
jgi:hypothetical protein